NLPAGRETPRITRPLAPPRFTPTRRICTPDSRRPGAYVRPQTADPAHMYARRPPSRHKPTRRSGRDEPTEQVQEALGRAGGGRAEGRGAHRLGEREGLLDPLLGTGQQVEQLGTPVGLEPASLDQATLLQLVDELDHVGPADREDAGQLGLGDR